MKRLLGLLLAVMVMMGGMAGAQASTDNASMQLIRMNPLAFIASAQANKLRPAPIVPNPLLCRAIPFPSQPHSSHPSLLPYLEKKYIRSQNVRSCARMFSFDARYVPSGYFVKRIFDHLSIFVTSDNFPILLLLKTTNTRSHIHATEKNLSHQQNPAGKPLLCGEFNKRMVCDTQTSLFQ